jgi:hypothetical protein
MLVLDRCRHCQDAFSPADEDNDLCYSCETSPVLIDNEPRAYLNCGADFGSQDGIGQFCSQQCASVGYEAIVNYRQVS